MNEEITHYEISIIGGGGAEHWFVSAVVLAQMKQDQREGCAGEYNVFTYTSRAPIETYINWSLVAWMQSEAIYGLQVMDA